MWSLYKVLSQPNINKLKRKGDIDGLIKALTSNKNSDIQRSAAEALDQLGESIISHGEGRGKLIFETLRKLQQSIPKHKSYDYLNEALQLREVGHDFEVLYQPEEGHIEKVTRSEPWGNDGGFISYEEEQWMVDSKERYKIVKTKGNQRAIIKIGA